MRNTNTFLLDFRPTAQGSSYMVLYIRKTPYAWVRAGQELQGKTCPWEELVVPVGGHTHAHIYLLTLRGLATEELVHPTAYCIDLFRGLLTAPSGGCTHGESPPDTTLDLRLKRAWGCRAHDNFPPLLLPCSPHLSTPASHSVAIHSSQKSLDHKST